MKIVNTNDRYRIVRENGEEIFGLPKSVVHVTTGTIAAAYLANLAYSNANVPGGLLLMTAGVGAIAFYKENFSTKLALAATSFCVATLLKNANPFDMDPLWLKTIAVYVGCMHYLGLSTMLLGACFVAYSGLFGEFVQGN